MSYQRDQALFDSFKVPHQVVAVVTDTILAHELATSFTNKCLFIITWVSITKSTHAAAGNVHNYPFPVYKRLYHDCVFLSFSVTTHWDHRSRHVCHAIFWQLLRTVVLKRFYIERMALLFSRFFMVDPKYLWFNGPKNCHIVNVSWLVKCYGNSTKRNWNVCCMHLFRLALRPIVFSA